MTHVPFIQRIRRTNGRIDLYFRKGDYRYKLLSLDGSPELAAEVEAILARRALIERAKMPKTGTVGGMLRKYTKSADFLALGSKVQLDYQRWADEMEADVGDVSLSEVSPGWISDLRDAWAPRGHRAASLRLQVLKNALKRAVVDKRIAENPFANIEKVKPPHDRAEQHPIWEDAEVEAAIALTMKRDLWGLARAIGLGRWAGFRRESICKIPLNARVIGYDDAGIAHPRIYWMTQKRKVLADKREDPRLTNLLSATPNKALTIAYNDRDQPWKTRSLNQAISRILEALAKTGTARAHLTIHGLRHSRGVELALAGASDGEIMSQLEHATDRAAKIYRRQADRRRMADSAQTRVDTVVDLRERRKNEAS